jgi:predicted transcriptional regulator
LIVEGIKRGLEDMKAGRLVSHEQAMAEIDAVIERAAQRRGK